MSKITLCKDCKYYGKQEHIAGSHICELHKHANLYVFDEDFCSNGQREDEPYMNSVKLTIGGRLEN